MIIKKKDQSNEKSICFDFHEFWVKKKWNNKFYHANVIDLLIAFCCSIIFACTCLGHKLCKLKIETLFFRPRGLWPRREEERKKANKNKYQTEKIWFIAFVFLFIYFFCYFVSIEFLCKWILTFCVDIFPRKEKNTEK